jgi:hypothetical protein
MTSGFDIFPWFKNFLVNPVTDWQRFINPQFNVTINQGDAAVENHVLSRAGSYGKQLGRVQEVLDILVQRLPTSSLSTLEKRSIDKYPLDGTTFRRCKNSAEGAHATPWSCGLVDPEVSKVEGPGRERQVACLGRSFGVEQRTTLDRLLTDKSIGEFRPIL